MTISILPGDYFINSCMKCVLSFKINVMLAGGRGGQVCAFLKETRVQRLWHGWGGASLITVFRGLDFLILLKCTKLWL